MKRKKRILFVNNAATHYYNLVLTKLSGDLDWDLTLAVPRGRSANVGEGVFEKRTGLPFKIVELEESVQLRSLFRLKGLARLIFKLRPDAIISTDAYAFQFILDPGVVAGRRLVGSRYILKSIPFGVPSHDEAAGKLRQDYIGRKQGGGLVRAILALAWYCEAGLKLAVRTWALREPDVHATYLESGTAIYSSYGVSPNRIIPIGNSPDTDLLLSLNERLSRVPYTVTRKRLRLIHVGRLVEWKRVDLLLRAFAALSADFPLADVAIVGAGPQEVELKGLASNLGIADKTDFVGGVYEPEILGRHLMSSGIYVLAGMGGLSINEAMCFGLPVVCSICDGTERTLVRDGYNGRFFENGNLADLITKIRSILEDPEGQKKMGLNSLQIIKNEVNIHTVVKGYEQAIKMVLDSPRKRPGPELFKNASCDPS